MQISAARNPLYFKGLPKRHTLSVVGRARLLSTPLCSIIMIRLTRRRSSLAPHEWKSGYETIGVSITILIVDPASWSPGLATLLFRLVGV